MIRVNDKILACRKEMDGEVGCIFHDCQPVVDVVPHKRLLLRLAKLTVVSGRLFSLAREQLASRKEAKGHS